MNSRACIVTMPHMELEGTKKDLFKLVYSQGADGKLNEFKSINHQYKKRIYQV